MDRRQFLGGGAVALLSTLFDIRPSEASALAQELGKTPDPKAPTIVIVRSKDGTTEGVRLEGTLKTLSLEYDAGRTVSAFDHSGQAVRHIQTSPGTITFTIPATGIRVAYEEGS